MLGWCAFALTTISVNYEAANFPDSSNPQVREAMYSKEVMPVRPRAKCGVDNARKWQVWWVDTIVACYAERRARWGKGRAKWRGQSSVVKITTKRRRCRGPRPTFVMPGAPRVGACLREGLVLSTSEAVYRRGSNHTSLLGEEPASGGGTHS